MRIGEALRTHGFDEDTVAGKYVEVLGKLSGPNPKAGGVQKLLVDVLKECSRQLESATEAQQEAEKEGERAASPDAPVIVHLVHTVPRPDRPGSESGNR